MSIADGAEEGGDDGGKCTSVEEHGKVVFDCVVGNGAVG